MLANVHDKKSPIGTVDPLDVLNITQAKLDGLSRRSPVQSKLMICNDRIARRIRL